MSDHLDRIIAEGTAVNVRPFNTYYERQQEKPRSQVVCADGFRVSVIAGPGCYCTPRPAFGGMLPLAGEVDSDYSGPYTRVEVGFPSERPEPWGEWSQWHDGEDPTKSVYGFVTVEAVRALVELHGGVV